MKKLLLVIFFASCFHSSEAQKEGRLGLYSGLYNSVLSNANDEAWGDLLPTLKMAGGIEGSYFVTVGQKVGVGITGQIGYWNNGTDYKGYYVDGSSYEAYARLKYIKTGLGLNISTNLRRRVALRVFGGANVGVLDSYQERYEHFRSGDSKLIRDITDRNVYYRDDKNVNQYGKLDEALYEPISISVYSGIGLDIKISDDWIFSLSGRLDSGLGQIENENKNSITFSGEDTRVEPYPAISTAIKYQVSEPDAVRAATTNQSMGVFVSFSYRMYNRDRTDIWYVY